jgi:hypothetical protein
MVTAPVELSEVRGRRRHDGPNRSTARSLVNLFAPTLAREGRGAAGGAS